MTALMRAANYDKHVTIETLLVAGANVAAKNDVSLKMQTYLSEGRNYGLLNYY